MESEIKSSSLRLMALAIGVCIANLYYCQPLLLLIHDSLGGPGWAIGLIPTATQVGYALGMMLLVPIGDMRDRRRLILRSIAVSIFVLLILATTHFLAVAIFASLLLGLSTNTPQLMILLVANLVSDNQRGRIVGTLMSGLLLGILLARALAGFVGETYGWRAMFFGASIGHVILYLLLSRILPSNQPSFHGSYRALLLSIIEIAKKLPALRETAFFGAMFFGAFSAFWANLIYLMQSAPFHLNAKAVGWYGLLGAVGALFAPLIGRFVDKFSPRSITGASLALTFVSFLLFMAWGPTSLIGLAVGVVLMDLGVQTGQIANQTRIFALLPEARSRINTTYMFSYYVGGASGTYLGALAWDHFGWTGVCSVALLMSGLGFAVYLLNGARTKAVFV